MLRRYLCVYLSAGSYGLIFTAFNANGANLLQKIYVPHCTTTVQMIKDHYGYDKLIPISFSLYVAFVMLVRYFFFFFWLVRKMCKANRKCETQNDDGHKNIIYTYTYIYNFFNQNCINWMHSDAHTNLIT